MYDSHEAEFGLLVSDAFQRHNILGDQPIESGGDDAGMTLPEWFLASLGELRRVLCCEVLPSQRIGCDWTQHLMSQPRNPQIRLHALTISKSASVCPLIWAIAIDKG
jgi:hypothetical protein